MARVIYLGDAVTQAGFRLAGVDARIIAAETAADELGRTIDDGAELVLMSGALAAFVPADVLAERLRGDPLLVIVPDICGAVRLPDLAHEVRGTLGIET